MTTMQQATPCVKPVRKPRQKPQRSLRWFRTSKDSAPLVSGALIIREGKATDAYAVEQLDSAFGAGYLVAKVVPSGVTADGPYHVNLSGDGAHSCECKGHLRSGHKTRCRHVAALLALTAKGELPPLEAPAGATAEAEADGDFAIPA
jgi:hypothetical protein